MLWGESLYHDIWTLVYDCHDCKHIVDGSCPEYCHDFIKAEIREICEMYESGSYKKELENRRECHDQLGS